MAEATRFELVVQLPVRQFSKLLVSATHPHFLMNFSKNRMQIYKFVFNLSKKKQYFHMNLPTFVTIFMPHYAKR